MSDPIFVVDDDRLAKVFSALHPRIIRTERETTRWSGARTRSAVWISHRCTGRTLSWFRDVPWREARVLCLRPIDGPHRELLHASFPRVVAADDGVKLLSDDEIADVLASPHREDLFLGGTVDEQGGAVVLYRGDLEPMVVSLDWFHRPSAPNPDPRDFEITDGGQTVRLGAFEAAADAILYEHDAEARRRAKKRAIEADTTFGGALRRLRVQRGLSRSDFPGVTAKEIARIERGEVSSPHAGTLEKIARRLKVPVAEIGTY